MMKSLSPTFSPKRRRLARRASSAIQFRSPAARLFVLLILVGVGTGLRAQEFTTFGGAGTDENLRLGSYSWMLDYRQGLYRPFEGSVTWINEGHFTDGSVNHHRDGLAMQAWYDLPFRAGKYNLSLGAGVDYFFDSQGRSVTDSAGDTTEQSLNVHQFAPLVSLDLREYITDVWFWRARATEIFPLEHRSNPNRLLFDVGLGYYFGSPQAPHYRQLPGIENLDPEDMDERWSVTFYKGFSRVNTFIRTGGNAEAAEFRMRYSAHIDLAARYLYEGDSLTVRRGGLAAQFYIVSDPLQFLGCEVLLGLGAGPYINIDSKHIPPGRTRYDVPAVAGLLSPTAVFNLPKHFFARVIWDRVVTNYSQDADVWLIGVGYRFH